MKLIAEIGINHNGDIKIAKKLIKLAKDNNFDIVKFQKRTIDYVYDNQQLGSFRKSPWGDTFRKQKEGLEFNKKDYDEIDEYCNEMKINWTASSWDLKSQDFINKYNVKYNKVASPMLLHKSLISKIAEEKKYTFISTGMSDTKIIDEVVNTFEKKNCKYELMHCVSTYPTKPEEFNLNTIYFLKERYKCNVGFSSHENGVVISLAAFAMGISSLERHITLDRTMYGSDQAASLEPQGIQFLSNGIEMIKKSLGKKEKLYLDAEKEIAKKLRYNLTK